MPDSTERLRWGRTVTRAAIGVGVIAAASWVAWAIPGTTVPQSGQTLAVVLVGAFAGARLSALTLVVYLLAGGAGLPLFADRASGWGHLVGPTAGYLAGFVVAAVLVGWASERGTLSRLVPGVGVMIGAHALILLLGWLRLGYQLGPDAAFDVGVEPFVVGGIVKGVLAAVLVVVATRLGWLQSIEVREGAPRWTVGSTSPPSR